MDKGLKNSKRCDFVYFIDPCLPNPCLSPGTCSLVGDDGYECDCHGYTGPNCEIGI